MRFDRVIVADWSASSAVGPRRPSPDRCWLAFADADDRPGRRPPPEYFRTRHDCEARLARLATEFPGSVLLALDFAIGYPGTPDDRPVLPTGRELCARLHELVEDAPDASNNRFEVASRLNRTIRERTGGESGPFWGHPPGRSYPDLPFRKPAQRSHRCREYRAVETSLRANGRLVQSPWKLAGAAAVGSQSLLGLAAVHRLLERAGDRGVLWPYEHADEAPARNAVVLGECWPSVADADSVDHPVKDARQVVALRDRLLHAGDGPERLRVSHPGARTEGWILGVPG
ncbi:MAG: hypothetical protein ACF8Q5_14930 [Phycisphaerales bacterium JB040]